MKQRSAPPLPITRRASRYQQPATQGNDTLSTRPLVTTEPLGRRYRVHYLTYFGIGMLIVLTVLAVWNLIIVPAWQNYQDQFHYRDARITRLDAAMGHEGVSTFLAFVLNRQVIIIEAPNGSMERANYYRTGNFVGTFSQSPVVSLSVANVDNVRNCLIIRVEGISSNIVLYNNGTGFQLTPSQ